MKLKNYATLIGSTGVALTAGLAIAAPSKSGGTVVTPVTTVLDPFKITTVTVTAPPTLMLSTPVVVSAAPASMSGISPGKGGGGTPTGGTPTAPPPTGGPTPPVDVGPATR